MLKTPLLMATTATLVETVTSVSPAEVNTTVPRKNLGTTLPGEIEMVDAVTVPPPGVDTKVAVDLSKSKTEILRSAFLVEVADPSSSTLASAVDPVDPLLGLNLRTAWESSGCL